MILVLDDCLEGNIFISFFPLKINLNALLQTHDTWHFNYLSLHLLPRRHETRYFLTLISLTSSSKDIRSILDAHTIRWFAILGQMHVMQLPKQNHNYSRLEKVELIWSKINFMKLFVAINSFSHTSFLQGFWFVPH